MKIAFVCIYSHPSICGVWSRVYNLSKMLIEKGHDIHVFSTNIIKGEGEKSLGFEVCENIKIHRFEPKLSVGENVKFWEFSSELKKLNPDIIITEVYRHPHTLPALKIAKKLKKPCFLTTHAPFVEPHLRSRTGNFLVNFYDKFYGKRILNKFDKIITITKWENPYLKKIGINESKIAYLPNGIPKEFFKIKRKKGSEKGKKLLFIGRISPIKNLETLIIAVKKLVKKYPNLQLKIIGPAEEEYKEKLLNLIKKLNLQKNIIFLPAVYDLKEKIKVIDDSDIFILPSKREAMPQSLIETMARGKIAIASDNKGASEIINDNENGNENGFLFLIGNSENLADTIDFCLNKKNQKKLNQIRKNAVAKAETFKWIKIFEQFQELLEKYVNNNEKYVNNNEMRVK